MSDPRTVKGIWYWQTRAGAEAFMRENHGWTRLWESHKGWVVQAGPCGNYAGPGIEPREWKGTVNA